MDFDFLTDAPQRRTAEQARPSSNAPATATSNGRPTINLPTYREVQQSEQSRTAPNLFRPGSLIPGPSAANEPRAASNGSTGPPPPAQVLPSYHPHSSAGPSMQYGAAAAAPAARPALPGPQTFAPSAHSYPGPAVQRHNMPSSSYASTSSIGGIHHPAGQAPGYNATGYNAAGYNARPATYQQASAHAQQHALAVAAGNAIIVSKRQQGNPVLKHFRNVRWQYGDIAPDYQLGASAAALFLSLRYHLLHPDYIMYRIKELQRAYRLCIVLCHVDVEDVVKPLADITKAAVLNDCTLVCAWTPEECARYLETFKSYENKPASGIQERQEHDYTSRLSAALTCVRGVNKTDAVTLGATFGSLADVLRATPQQLSACPGIGPTKVRRLMDTFNEPFRKTVRQPGAAAPAPTSNEQGHAAATPAAHATPAASAAALDGAAPILTQGVPTYMEMPADDDIEDYSDFDDVG